MLYSFREQRRLIQTRSSAVRLHPMPLSLMRYQMHRPPTTSLGHASQTERRKPADTQMHNNGCFLGHVTHSANPFVCPAIVPSFHRSNVGAPLIPSTRASLLSTDPIGTRWTEDESGGVVRWETRRLLGRSSRHIYIDDTFTDKWRLLRHPTTLLVLAASFLFRRTPTTPPRSTGYAL
eukprot:scaffold13862_cov200-Alexandrium_tamarense.AAC.4